MCGCDLKNLCNYFKKTKHYLAYIWKWIIVVLNCYMFTIKLRVSICKLFINVFFEMGISSFETWYLVYYGKLWIILHTFGSGMVVGVNYYMFVVKLRVSFYKLFVNVILEWVRVVLKHGIYSTRGNYSYLAYSWQ